MTVQPLPVAAEVMVQVWLPVSQTFPGAQSSLLAHDTRHAPVEAKQE